MESTNKVKKLMFNPNLPDMFAVFKPYQWRAMQFLWSQCELDKSYTSREVWVAVNKDWNRTVSRASIINFLNRMSTLSYLVNIEEYGKGGKRGHYSSRYTQDECIAAIKANLIEEIVERMG